MTKLPFRVTLLLWLVLSLTLWNLLRLWTSLAWFAALNKFSAQPSPIIIAINGAIFSLAGLAILWGIWREKKWTANVTLATATIYTLWYWGEQFIWQAPRPNWMFAVIVNLALVIFVIYAVKIVNPKS